MAEQGILALMPRSQHTPPIKRSCPRDESGGELCDFYYEAIRAQETDGDWLAQFCRNCKHLMFIDKKKLAHGSSQ